jgi:phosphoglycerol transferase MdoB-like AlkP superfamily enzyme
MFTAESSGFRRFASIPAISRRSKVVVGLVAMLHLAALGLMLATEVDLIAKLIFLLFWALLNFSWLTMFRRPSVAAILSLELVAVLIILSQFKHDKLWMTADFVDVMIVDHDTSAFLLAAFPSLSIPITAAAMATGVFLALAWRLDPVRIRARTSSLCGLLCLSSIIALSLGRPTDLQEDFLSQNYVSKFARTGIEAAYELLSHGYLEADLPVAEGAKSNLSTTCKPTAALPNIILLHDESSYDVTAAPGIKVPPGYERFFQSFDGKARKLIVEGAGGPSWFTEYNVLTGLSALSFGRFATSVTRIAAGHIRRGLAHSLSQCGYKTFTLYPFYGAFLGSRVFQTTTGIQHYQDMHDLGTRNFEADSFYFDQAIGTIARNRGTSPLFIYVYTVANHFPWDTRLRPELTPNWLDLGNASDVDEYIRRQTLTASDYRTLLNRLAHEFPTESFLIVRYGDHQPQFAPRLIDPSLSQEALARHLEAFDPRYYTTYYAIDTVNFAPVDVRWALDTLDAPYLPLVVQAAAGVPLDPSFFEQKNILIRCRGLFYRCQGGAEARRFNRLLIEAGLIKGL